MSVRSTLSRKGSRSSRRVGATLILAVVAMMGVVGIANAEGSFTSHLDNVAPGFGSRTWDDRNTDAHATRVRTYNCWNNRVFRAEARPTYELLRRNTASPVTSFGRVEAPNCKGTRYSYATWPRPGRGTFNFAYRLVNGESYPFSASEIYVTW